MSESSYFGCECSFAFKVSSLSCELFFFFFYGYNKTIFSVLLPPVHNT